MRGKHAYTSRARKLAQPRLPRRPPRNRARAEQAARTGKARRADRRLKEDMLADLAAECAYNAATEQRRMRDEDALERAALDSLLSFRDVGEFVFDSQIDRL